jgi:N-acetylmuramate 1-kinase
MTEQHTSQGAAVPERIEAYLHESGLAERHPQVVPLTGDASDRRYFRILLSGADSVVLAVHAGPIDFATLPFANVARLLQRMGVPSPAILGHSDELGILELQDLGDVTLQAHLGSAPVEQRADLYRQAILLIIQLQQQGGAFAGTEYIPYSLAFDVEKLTFELNFFSLHFLERYRGAELTVAERHALASEWSAIVEELAAEPRVLCHRDYHSRNLMVHEGGLYMIDFQDARMGPDTYDLVSLLRDSYVDVTDAELDAFIAHFRGLAGIPDAATFRRRFDLMAVQRNLKALGTFGFQTTARGNTAYVESMPRTLRYVKDNLSRYERFGRLHTLLAAHIEELR